MDKMYISNLFSKNAKNRTVREQEDIMMFMNLVIFLDILDIKWHEKYK